MEPCQAAEQKPQPTHRLHVRGIGGGKLTAQDQASIEQAGGRLEIAKRLRDGRDIRKRNRGVELHALIVRRLMQALFVELEGPRILAAGGFVVAIDFEDAAEILADQSHVALVLVALRVGGQERLVVGERAMPDGTASAGGRVCASLKLTRANRFVARSSAGCRCW